jgi:hypothetical protein
MKLCVTISNAQSILFCLFLCGCARSGTSGSDALPLPSTNQLDRLRAEITSRMGFQPEHVELASVISNVENELKVYNVHSMTDSELQQLENQLISSNCTTVFYKVEFYRQLKTLPATNANFTKRYH